jgi:hypothetical protein
MHTFGTISGTVFDGCTPVSVKTEDGKYRTAIDIAKAAIGDTVLSDGPARRGNTMIVLFRQEDNKLKLLNPSDIIDEPTDFVAVNINDKTLELCAKEGLIDIAKWLRAYDHEWTHNIIPCTAEYGQKEFAKWAIENGCPWDNYVISDAAKRDNIEFIKWAIENGCPWGNGVMTLIVQHGNIEFAKWARENGCPWEEGIISAATSSGKIEFANWARDSGCLS